MVDGGGRCRYSLRKKKYRKTAKNVQYLFLTGSILLALATGAWTTLEAGLDPRGNLYLSAMGDGRADYYPKFCPECGKKIAEGVTPETCL